MKILLLDIETSPNTAYVWGIWQENITLDQIIDTSKVLCWSAKWYGEDELIFDSIHKSSHKAMIKRIHKLLCEADAVITYNGAKFDLPILNKEFLLAGLPPPSPYKSIDLYKTTKSKFKFVSNKLDFINKQLGIGAKHKVDFMTWVKCMQKDSEAWTKMEAYNKNDVVELEKLYNVLLPWIKTHPNHSVHSGDLVCPRCGGYHYQKRGTALTTTGKYTRYQCKDCGHWFRENKTLAPTEKFISYE